MSFIALSRKAKKIKDVQAPFIRRLARNLHQLMLEQTNAVGLAAPQINAQLRMFTMARLDETKTEIEDYQTILNPIVFETRGDEKLDFECCFSVPNICGIVPRSEDIQVKYTTLDGKIQHERLFGLEARVFQHELDHLNGIVFTQKAIRTIPEQVYLTASSSELEKLKRPVS